MLRRRVKFNVSGFVRFLGHIAKFVPKCETQTIYSAVGVKLRVIKELSFCYDSKLG